MMVEWWSKHVGANKWEKKYTLLVHLLVSSLTIYHNAQYRTYKTQYIAYAWWLVYSIKPITGYHSQT